MRTRFKRSRVIGLPFRTQKSQKATKRLAPVHRMHSSGTYTYCWIYCRAVPPAATGAKMPHGPTLVQLPETMATFNDGVEWWTDDPCTKQELADVKDWLLGLEKVKN